MRHVFLAAAGLAALIASAPASFAFTITQVPTGGDGYTKFSDPDNLTDSMHDNLTGDNGAGGVKLGSTSLRVYGGNGGSALGGGSGMSPALRQQLMLGPGYGAGH